jgi:hypothetical protein
VRAVEDDRIDTVKIDWDRGDFGSNSVNIYGTVIHRSDLARFLRAAGHPCAMFEDPADGISADRAPRFASKKLNAAIRAAQALASDPALLRGRTPKQAAKAWLEKHAAELQLLNSDGGTNATAIEEIAKVVNWKPQGGVPATPGAEPAPVNGYGYVGFTAPLDAAPRERFIADLDDEIPF